MGYDGFDCINCDQMGYPPDFGAKTVDENEMEEIEDIDTASKYDFYGDYIYYFDDFYDF